MCRILLLCIVTQILVLEMSNTHVMTLLPYSKTTLLLILPHITWVPIAMSSNVINLYNIPS